MPLVIVTGAYALGWWRLRGRGSSVPGWRVVASGGGSAEPVHRTLGSARAVGSRELRRAHGSASPSDRRLPRRSSCSRIRSRRSCGRSRHAARARRPVAPAGRALRQLWRGLTLMSVAWLAHTAAVWLWHLPIAYDAAVADRLVHDLEHLAFFGTAVLFWWPIVEPAPRLRPAAGYGARVVFLVLAALQGALLGLLLTMSPRILYRAYPSAEDQSLAVSSCAGRWRRRGHGRRADLAGALSRLAGSGGIPPTSRSVREGSLAFLARSHLRLRLRQPEPDVHLAVHRQREPQVLLRLLSPAAGHGRAGRGRGGSAQRADACRAPPPAPGYRRIAFRRVVALDLAHREP